MSATLLGRRATEDGRRLAAVHRHPSSILRLSFFLLPSFFFLLLSACNKLPPPFGPTPTPTATYTPTYTHTPTLTPSPTPTPTPIPPARIEAADRALFEGDWSLAIAEYQAALAQSDDPAIRSAARLGLGKTRLQSGDSAGAINELAAFLQEFPESPHAADARFLLGEAQRASGQWAEAIEAYRAYLQLRPGVIDSYVHERIALAASLNQDYAAAEQAYLAALAAPRAEFNEALDLRERLAQTYTALGDANRALAQYESIFQATDQNWRKAHVRVLAGTLLYNLGRANEAYAKFLDAVNNYPEASDTYQGLLILVNDGVPVDDLQRGLTNYYAENYPPALAALDRYLAAHPDADATALYHQGLTLHALGQGADAIAAFREIVENHPNDPLWARAYFQIAFLQPYPQDAQTFQDFVAAAPQSPDAPDALYRAARLAERNGDFALAVGLWTRIAQEYPAAAQAADAAAQAGIVFYRAGEIGSAAQRFQIAATLGTDPQEHARAWLWIGKVEEKMGDADGARAAWIKAAALAPHTYYSLRAEELMRGAQPFSAPPAQSFTFDAERERAEAEKWLREKFPLAQSVSVLSELPPGVWREPRFVRGAELWRLGLLREAHAEFDSLRRDLSGDALAMWPLAIYFNEIGAYDLSIRSARSVVDLAGLADTLAAPRYLLRLRYPAPFSARVLAASDAYGLHPFLMYSKMRLESFFWKYAISSAEARGLNQIIPPTADDIARRLGLTDFTHEDLYRPSISIPMGAFYLAFVGETTEADPPAMLAGYYAGPGNAQIWRAMSGGDPDLFVEVIRLPDAKNYVQTAYEYFMEYRELYEGGSSGLDGHLVHGFHHGLHRS
jgi:soluble lytic murein transglycosylase